jgi:hypothetical protein
MGYLCRHLKDSDRKCRPLLVILLLMYLLAVILTPIIITLKLDGIITASWGLVFLPVWWILLTSCCIPLSHALPSMSKDNRLMAGGALLVRHISAYIFLLVICE